MRSPPCAGDRFLVNSSPARSRDIYYPAAPHGITATRQDQVNAGLLAFVQS
jgi:hypothetical protein